MFYFSIITFLDFLSWEAKENEYMVQLEHKVWIWWLFSKHQRTCFWSIFLLVFHRPGKKKYWNFVKSFTWSHKFSFVCFVVRRNVTCRSISSRDSSVAMGASNADLNSQDSVTSATELMLEWRLVDCGRACWPATTAPSLAWKVSKILQKLFYREHYQFFLL